MAVKLIFDSMDFGCIGRNDFLFSFVNSEFLEWFEIELRQWAGTINDYNKLGIEFPISEEFSMPFHLPDDCGCIGSSDFLLSIK